MWVFSTICFHKRSQRVVWRPSTQLELQFKNTILSKVVDEPHNPIAFGKDDDRVLRIESYVKNFKPLNLGTIDIKKGKGELSLKIPEIPGNEGIEFRLLMLRRIS